tara:strand:- start:484 stop:963 length:480 start_codon:yes stop_codon:yes gene_type:complete
MLTATKSSIIDISKESATKSLANLFAKNLSETSALFLYGNVGVGKTTFVKHLINAIQFLNNEKITEVPSPTFNIVNEYEIKNKIFQHFDLYRIKNKEDLNNLGIFENNKATKLIEWPELLESKEFKMVYKLNFEYDKDMKNRFLKIYSNNKIKFINEFK